MSVTRGRATSNEEGDRADRLGYRSLKLDKLDEVVQLVDCAGWECMLSTG